MDSDTVSKWLICRICLGNDKKELYTIFAEEADDEQQVLENLKEKIEQFGGISLSEHNNLPNKICYRCLLLLRAACRFRELCEQSQKQLYPFITPLNTSDKLNLEVDINQVISHSELEEDDDCVLINQEANVGNDFFAEEEQSKESHTAIPEPTHYDIKQFINEDDDDDDEEEDHRNITLTHDVTDHLVEEDTTEYVYEPTNESSQDTNDQLLHDDTSNPYDIAQNNLNVQYSDVVIGDTKFSIHSADDNDLNEELDNVSTSVKAGKRKRCLANDKTKQEGKLYNCSFCSNVYQDKAKYAMHIKMHKKVKPHECEICSKRFSTTPQLSRHMNSHTGNRPYKCKYCEARFGDPSTRIKHERIHTNERPYICKLCSKSFAYSNVLKVHMMVHTGERPHVCAYCERTFSQIHHKNAHEKRHQASFALEIYENDVDIDDELKEYVIP